MLNYPTLLFFAVLLLVFDWSTNVVHARSKAINSTAAIRCRLSPSSSSCFARYSFAGRHPKVQPQKMDIACKPFLDDYITGSKSFTSIDKTLVEVPMSYFYSFVDKTVASAKSAGKTACLLFLENYSNAKP